MTTSEDSSAEMRADLATVSVRGEAGLYVTPDSGTFACTISATAPDAGSASDDVARRETSLVDSLRELGGSEADVTRVESRLPLVWSAQRLTVTSARDRHGTLTGQTDASLAVSVCVRDLGLSAGVLAAATAVTANIVGPFWAVDDDNVRWPQVRRLAVHDAVRQAHEYADALSGSVLRLIHLADTGLLDGSGGGQHFARAGSARGGAGWSPAGEETRTPDLTPTPQRLSASVEARFALGGLVLPGPA